jgi:hypothetical protein
MSGKKSRLNISLAFILAATMCMPAFPTLASGPENSGSMVPRVTDDSYDLIVGVGETYETYGCHTYANSIQINGTLKVKPYDGSDNNTGALSLQANWISVGSTGTIIADGRGYGGGGGATETAGFGGAGGMGGKGGNGDGGRTNGGGGGGGSNGSLGGNAGTYGTAGSAGIETGGGSGGNSTSTASKGGAGGTGFGAGGGGGAGNGSDGGGGGGGGSGGLAGSGNITGGNGAGTAKGTGGSGTASKGNNGGYLMAGSNGDMTTDMTIQKGSGGGGGASGQYYGGGGGGGAGGGSVSLISTGNITIDGMISVRGGGGGRGGQDSNGWAGDGGGGGGGGVLLFGQKVTVTGSIDARGRMANALSVTNGGTVKIFYAVDQFSSATIQAGRKYTNGRPFMQGLLSPENNGLAPSRPEFSWRSALDQESEPVTYQLQVATSPNFTNLSLDVDKISGTTYNSPMDFIGPAFYWRVRAFDATGPGIWSNTWKFLADSTPPISKVSDLPTYTNTTNFTVSWSGIDDSSGIATFTIFKSESNEPFSPWLENTTTHSAVFDGVDGVKYSFYSTAVDKATNREAQHNSTDACITVDTSPPSSKVEPLPLGQSTLSFNVSWSGNDSTSGVRYYNIFVSDNGGQFEVWQSQTANTSAKFNAKESHAYSFYSIASDFAGNYEPIPGPDKEVTTRIDLTAPATTLQIGDPHYGQEPVFVTSATPFSLNCTDNYVGVNSTWYAIDSRELQQYTMPVKENISGNHNLTCWSSDLAGNIEQWWKCWFFVDSEPPVTSMVRTGPGWDTGTKLFVTTNTNISFRAMDAASGVARTEYNLDNSGYTQYAGPLSFDAAGTHSILYRSVDHVGNVEAEKSIKITVDLWAPVTNATADTLISNSNITVTFNPTDADSGVNRTFYRVIWEDIAAGDYLTGTEVVISAREDHSADGNYTVQYYSADNMNNTELARVLKVNIDTRAPVTKATVDKIVSNANITVTLIATDAGSGVNGTFYRVLKENDNAGDYLTGENIVISAKADHSTDGNYTVQYYSTDKVNNIEQAHELKVMIDTQVFLQLGFTGIPSVNKDRYTIEGSTEPGAKMAINNDEVSVAVNGSFAYEMKLKPGRNNATINITDSAGNTLAQTVNIDYNKPSENPTTILLSEHPTSILPIIIIIAVAVAAITGAIIFLRKKRKGRMS